MKNILIAGGTGLVGKHLQALLKEKGYQVALLSRRAGPNTFTWDPSAGTIDPEAIVWADAIVNLAGAGIADKRWSEARKKELVDSRVQSAEVLCQALKSAAKSGIPYVSASAIGYYGNSGEALMTEDSKPTDQSFMVQCCQAWEDAADTPKTIGMRVVKLRIGVVLDKKAGALAEIIKPMRFGVGAWFGNGQMWMSWIHHNDLCQIILWAVEKPNIKGTFNAVAPNPSRNKDLTKAAKATFAPYAILAPAPTFGLKLTLGEMSAVVLNSNRVSAQKLINAGFTFAYPNLEAALHAIASEPA